MSNGEIVVIAVQLLTFAVSYGTLIQRVKNLEEDVEELQIFTGLKSKKTGAGK